MKLNHTSLVKRKTAGMTLLELTVVILVLLSLISILFIGARAWKKGSDRAANILNVRNVQQAVRANANVKGLSIGDNLDKSDIVGGLPVGVTTGTGKEGYLKDPQPPVTGQTYKYGTKVPVVGALYITNPEIGGASGEYFYDVTATSTETAATGNEASKIADW